MSRSTATALPPLPPVRAEYEVALQPLDPALVAAAAPTRWQAPPWLRKALVLAVLVAVWEIAARVVGDDGGQSRADAGLRIDRPLPAARADQRLCEEGVRRRLELRRR